MKTTLERDFQAKLVKDIEAMFPECIVLKNDPNYRQGIPDLLILWGDRWAVLECKRSIDEILQPNQGYYVVEMNRMSFAAVIAPENREEVLDALSTSFRVAR